MLGTQFSKLRNGLFGSRDSVNEAMEYAKELLPRGPETTTALMVFYNTIVLNIAHKLDNMSDSELIKQHFGIDIENDPDGIDKLVSHLICDDLEDDDEVAGESKETPSTS